MSSGIKVGSLVSWQCGERLAVEHGIILKRYKAKDLLLIYKDISEEDDEWYVNLIYNLDSQRNEEFFSCYLTLVVS